MSVPSKLSSRPCPPWLAAFVVGTLLAVWVVGRGGERATTVGALDRWDVPRLAAYLNARGLGLRVVSTSQDGTNNLAAYLTTTDGRWEDFNRLTRDPRQIDQWRGTLICERASLPEVWKDRIGPSEDGYLIVGPFLLYGDRDLRDRVRAALRGFVLLEGGAEPGVVRCPDAVCQGPGQQALRGPAAAVAAFHHKAFDLGAFTAEPDGRVLVSEELNGDGQDVLLSGKALTLVPTACAEDRPKLEFLAWHRAQVFRGRPRG
jgi:hypothetical protein